MPSGVINGTTNNEYIASKIEWSYTQSKNIFGQNTWDIKATLYYRRTNTGYVTSGRGRFAIVIDDTTKETSQYLAISDSWVKAVEATKTIKQDANALNPKTISIYASGGMNDDDVSLKTTYCSGTVDLAPTVMVGNISSLSGSRLGEPCHLEIGNYNSSCSYRLTLTLGDWSETFYNVAFNPDPLVPTYARAEITLPLEAANQIQGSSSHMTAVLYTVYGSISTGTDIGYTSKKFFVEVPYNEDTKPAVSVTTEAVSSLDNKFSGVYVQGLSKVKATVAGEGKYNAEIKAYGISMLGKDYPYSDVTEYESGYLTSTGEVTITGKVKDSRGFTNTVEHKINVLPYGKPTILPISGESAIVCARCDKDGNLIESGEYLKIKARRSYSTITADGSQENLNLCTLRYRYAIEGTKFTGDEGWIPLLEGSDTSTDEVNKTISGVVLSAQQSYVVQIGVIDDIGYSYAMQFIVPTDFVTLDVPEEYRGRRIGLGRYVDGTDEDGAYFGFPIFGGSIDSLKLGTMLAATANAPIDLDNMSTPGCYYSPDKDTTQYISHAPANVNFGFGLEIRELQSKENIRQTLYYGITTWYRHRDKSGWSAWVSSLTGVSDEVIAHDFVVDSGTSGLWKYRMWQSGEAELWGVITLDTFGDVRHIYCNAGLPFTFIEYPTVSMTISQAVAYEYTQGAIVLSEVYTVGASTIKLMMIRDEGGLASGNTAKVSVSIKGRYK